jgi:hypothetical protein
MKALVESFQFPHFANFAMSILPTWTIWNRHKIGWYWHPNDPSSLCLAQVCVLPLFHQWKNSCFTLVLLFAKFLDHPIQYFTFSCNKQILIEKPSFNKYIIDTHWTKLNVASFSFKSSHLDFSLCNYDLL